MILYTVYDIERKMIPDDYEKVLMEMITIQKKILAWIVVNLSTHNDMDNHQNDMHGKTDMKKSQVVLMRNNRIQQHYKQTYFIKP